MLTFRFSKFQLAFAYSFLCLAFVCSIKGKAQYLLPIGARANAIGGSTITLPDAFAVFSNPASTTIQEQNSVGLFYDHRYNISGLSNLAFAGNFKIKKTTILGGIARSGDELLNHCRLEVAIAHKIRNVSLGGGAGYHQIMVSENGVAQNITFQFGGVAELTPKLTYGAHIYNILRSKVSKEKSIYYPVIMRMGLSYKPIKKVFISAEIEKDSRFEPNFKAGMEYQPFEKLYFRTGFNSNPSNGFFGIGIKLKEWKFDYGIALHNRLGLTHYIGLEFGLTAISTKNSVQPENPQ
ncbi:MAG: hypothetical protein H7329_17360 [Opitutaceae bacterium]|nr:hypothetical protein [Cytophagales bacterium]